MKKILISTIIAFLLFFCLNKESTENDQNEDIVKTDLNQDDLGEYAVIEAPNRPDERIVGTPDVTPSDISTTHLKNKTLITTFNGNLGSFGLDNDIGLELQFTSMADDPELKIGTYFEY